MDLFVAGNGARSCSECILEHKVPQKAAWKMRWKPPRPLDPTLPHSCWAKMKQARGMSSFPKRRRAKRVIYGRKHRYSYRRTPMELCRSHDSNCGVSKIGINYLKLPQRCSGFALPGIVVRIGRVKHLTILVDTLLFVPASDDFYRDSGPFPRDLTACMSKWPTLEALTSRGSIEGLSAHVGHQIIGVPCLSPSPISSLEG